MVELDEILKDLKLERGSPRPDHQESEPKSGNPTNTLQVLAESPLLSNDEKRAAAWTIQWMVKQGTTPTRAIKKYVGLLRKGQ